MPAYQMTLPVFLALLQTSCLAKLKLNSRDLSTPSAEISNLRAKSLSTTAIRLEWADSLQDKVDFLVSSAQGSVPPADCSDAKVTSDPFYVAGDLKEGAQYAFRVCARSGERVSAGTTVSQFLLAPDPLAIEAAAQSDSKIKISWTSGGGGTAAFAVAVTDLSTGETPSECVSGTHATVRLNDGDSLRYVFVAPNLKSNTRYGFRVCAANAADPVAYSSGVTVEAQTAISPAPNPSDLTATRVSSSEVKLTWKSRGGSTSGFVIALANLNSSVAPTSCTSGTTVDVPKNADGSLQYEYVVSELKANTNYAFRVCAKNSAATPDLSDGLTAQARTKYANVLVAVSAGQLTAEQAMVYRIPAAAAQGNTASEAFTVSADQSEKSIRGFLALPGKMLLPVAIGIDVATPNITSIYGLSDTTATELEHDFLDNGSGGMDQSTYSQDVTLTHDGYFAMMMVNGVVHFYTPAGTLAHSLPQLGSSDYYRAVELPDHSIVTVGNDGNIIRVKRLGTRIDQWGTPTSLGPIAAGSFFFGFDYCPAQNKLIVGRVVGGLSNKDVYACDPDTGSCTHIVSDYAPGNNAWAFTLRVDPNTDDCAFFLGTVDQDTNQVDVLRFSSNGAVRDIFAPNIRTCAQCRPYGLDFEIEAP